VAAVSLIERIERATNAPGLVDALGTLSPADLRSLLLEVHRRQAARVTPAQVLAQYRRDRFTGPTSTDPAVLAAFDRFAFDTLRARGYTPVELSPVAPLGTVSVLSPLDQNLVLTTARGTELVADSTNVLALESAVRRSGRDRVRLCASHRLLRTQPFPRGWSPHFRLLALTIAGRDEGSFRFETESLREQLSAMLALLTDLDEVRLTVTDLGDRRDLLAEHVLAPLAESHPRAEVTFDDAREKGRGYYVDACFDISARGISFADGGFTTWTRQLLGNAKERMLTGGLGVDMLHTNVGLPKS
jgi:hypothetical protein